MGGYGGSRTIAGILPVDEYYRRHATDRAPLDFKWFSRRWVPLFFLLFFKNSN